MTGLVLEILLILKRKPLCRVLNQGRSFTAQSGTLASPRVSGGAPGSAAADRSLEISLAAVVLLLVIVCCKQNVFQRGE